MRNEAAIAHLSYLVSLAAKIKHSDGRDMTVADFMHRAKTEEEEPTVDEAITGALSVMKAKTNG